MGTRLWCCRALGLSLIEKVEQRPILHTLASLFGWGCNWHLAPSWSHLLEQINEVFSGAGICSSFDVRGDLDQRFVGRQQIVQNYLLTLLPLLLPPFLLLPFHSWYLDVLYVIYLLYSIYFIRYTVFYHSCKYVSFAQSFDIVLFFRTLICPSLSFSSLCLFTLSPFWLCNLDVTKLWKCIIY